MKGMPMEKVSLSDRFNVLVVDDEPLMVDLIKTIVEREPYLNVTTARGGKEALKKLNSNSIDILISDIRMPDVDGFKLLETIKDSLGQPLVIMVTALNDASSAIRSLKLGAYDYITKPLIDEELLHVIRRGAESLQLQRENEYLWSRIEGPWTLNQIIGKSPEMQEVFKTIQRAARSDATVLIEGETGTGKELVAAAIHDLSARHTKPLVVVDCSALSGTLLTSELFGYVKGAFTGAYQSKKGLLEVADGGTVFFDEIGDMDISLQPKLLRALQLGEVRRVGDTRPVKVDLRVVAATNQPLAEMVEEGKFRSDLFYRLHVIPIHLPPLRERTEDIPLLIQNFLTKAASELNTPSKVFTATAVEAMMEHPWPGNVRELENEVARIVALCPKDEITVDDLSPKFIKSTPSPSILVSTLDSSGHTYKEAKRLFLDKFQYNYVKAQLEKHGGNVSKAASASGMERRTFQRIMKKATLSRTDFTDVGPPGRSDDMPLGSNELGHSKHPSTAIPLSE